MTIKYIKYSVLTTVISIAVNNIYCMTSQMVNEANNLFLVQDTLRDEKPVVSSIDKVISNQSSEEDIQLSGFIIDDTKSKFGRDFYESFYTNWSFPTGVSMVDILIKESPPMFSTTVITIQVGEVETLSFKLSPRVNAMEEYASAAIAEVQNYLIRLAEIEQNENFNSAGVETF